MSKGAPDTILVVLDGKLLFANAAVAALIGFADAEAWLDRDIVGSAEPRAPVIDLIRYLYAQDRAASFLETKLACCDGTLRDVDLMSCKTLVFVRDITERKRAESELRASESSYRQVVESMNEALIVYDPEANVKFVNQQFAKMFGCLPADVIGKPASEVYAPETLVHLERGIERRRRGLHDRYEAPLVAKDGKRILAQISAAPLVHDGEFAGSLALMTDITDREETREKLRHSERRYHELVDSSPNFIVSFDCHGRYTAANRAVCDVLGLREEEILGRMVEEVGIPDDVACNWRAQMALTMAERQPQTAECTVSFRGGVPRVLRRTVSPILDDKGSVVGVSGISIDITGQTRSEERNQKLLRAIEEMDEVMFTTDAGGVITYVNPAFERIYGYTWAEAVGRTPSIIKSGATPPAVYEELWRELEAGHTVRTEFVNRRKDGRLLSMVASISPMHGDDGRLTGFTAVQRDVTAERRAQEERTQLERQLAHSARMQALGTLAGGIAHDFNNILSIVITHAAIAELSADNRERRTMAIDTIKRAVQRGAGLARQILTFARKADVQFSIVDVNRVVREIGSMLREMFPKNIQIELATDADLPVIRADADQLHQALLNLCLNARDAMSDGGTLRVTTRRIARDAIHESYADALDCDHINISVSDTGSGMDEQTLSRMFEPFFTTKERGKGGGLGLAVVYGILKTHQGWIEVSSEPGRGSTFQLWFPASAAMPGKTAGDALEPARGNARLLLIEDEREIADALTMEMAERGYRVVCAHRADEALHVLRDPAERFDAVVTDLGIPGTSAIEFVKLLRAAAPDLPLIPMTGYIDPDLHRDVVAEGTEPILEKPFAIEELLQRIAQAMSA